MISQDSVLSPATSEAVASGTGDNNETPSQSNTTTGTSDAKTVNDVNGPDMRGRSISDVANARSRMASIAEGAETNVIGKDKNSTLTHKNAVNAMHNGEQNSEGTNVPSGDPQTSPQKQAITVPPQVTDVPNPDSNQNTMSEIPVLPNVVIYSNSSEKGDQSESPFSYTVSGVKPIELEASHSFVEVYDA